MKLSNLDFTAPLLAATSFFLLTGYSSCDPILENNGFDLWCGDELCAWQVDKGSVERVPTWHTGDYGVSLVGEDAAISQLRDIDGSQVSCLRFDLVVKAELTAELTLELDFYGDGNVDYRQPIPSSDWNSVSYLVPLPLQYEGIRFRVSKRGPGEAILAQIYADDSEACTNNPGTPVNRPNGAGCDLGNECASGQCSPGVVAWSSTNVCSTCGSDADCDGGEICGAVVPELGPHLGMYRACVAPAQRALGERCALDAECETGICNDNVCSSCTAGSCTGDGYCEPRRPAEREDELILVDMPHQCDPLEGQGMTEDWCLSDADCASGACYGTSEVRVCELDGRTCETGDDCPDDLACRTIGTASGICQ